MTITINPQKSAQINAFNHPLYRTSGELAIGFSEHKVYLR